MAQSSEILAFLTTSAKRRIRLARLRQLGGAGGPGLEAEGLEALEHRRRLDRRGDAFVQLLAHRRGRALGTNAATQVFSSKSFGPPASATVGTSGYEGSRAGAASASSLTRLAWYRFCTVAAVPKAQSTSPLATAV